MVLKAGNQMRELPVSQKRFPLHPPLHRRGHLDESYWELQRLIHLSLGPTDLALAELHPFADVTRDLFQSIPDAIPDQQLLESVCSSN